MAARPESNTIDMSSACFTALVAKLIAGLEDIAVSLMAADFMGSELLTMFSLV